MFQGIADQISEATKEVRQQNVLRHYVGSLEKQEKANNRLKKKIESRLVKISVPQVSVKDAEKSLSLRSLFFYVFKKQGNEQDPVREDFLNSLLTAKNLAPCNSVYSDQIKACKPKLKHGREVNSLEHLIKKIKTGTKEKYYSHEVLSMLQFIERLSQARAKNRELERALNIGKITEKHLHSIIKNLAQEENWGSWELVASKNADYKLIPESAIDRAFRELPLAHAYIECFKILATPFLENRNLILHGQNLHELYKSFIDNMINDWIYADKIKGTRSKTNQVLSSVKTIIHGLEVIQNQNSSEIDLLEIETSVKIKETGKQVEKKLSERF